MVRKAFLFALAAVLLVAASSNADARSRHHHRHYAHRHHASHSHVATAHAGFAVIRAATGATAVVARDVADKFQALIRKLEDAGAVIKDMGGLRHTMIAGTDTWSKHSVGHAIDICQRARNVVDGRCRLPRNATQIAASVGLTHGAVWGNPDRGHFEARGSNPGHGGRRYASLGWWR